MRRSLHVLILILASVLATLTLAAPAQAASCSVTWGSLAKSAGTAAPTTAPLAAVRAGQHTCYDRLVVGLTDAAGWGSYAVAYGTVRGVASGEPIPVSGGAALQITLRAHGESSALGDPERVVAVNGFRTFRQVVWGGSFEGTTVLGLGVRARLPFRVFVLPGPAAGRSRLVIDVAHAW